MKPIRRMNGFSSFWYALSPARSFCILMEGMQTEQGVWLRTREFIVTAKNSKRKWGIKPSPEIDENADYVPTYAMPQLFKWKGYWVEVQRTRPAKIYTPPGMQPPGATIFIT